MGVKAAGGGGVGGGTGAYWRKKVWEWGKKARDLFLHSFKGEGGFTEHLVRNFQPCEPAGKKAAPVG